MDFPFEPIWKEFKKLQKKSKVTYEHSIRVADSALKLTERLISYIESGTAEEYLLKLVNKLKLSNFDELRYIAYETALHHDIGKIDISDKILNKKGKLSPDEFEEIKYHPSIGVAMLINVGCEDEDILEGIHFSHEKLDGSGYSGVTEENIGIIPRIVTIADIFDTIVIPHINGKKAKNEKRAALELTRDDGLDQYLVRNFIEMEGIQISISDKFKNKPSFQIQND